MVTGRKLDPCSFKFSLLLVLFLHLQIAVAKAVVDEYQASPLLKSELANLKDKLKKNGTELQGVKELCREREQFYCYELESTLNLQPCIARNLVCDHKEDCYKGEDEKDCKYEDVKLYQGSDGNNVPNFIFDDFSITQLPNYSLNGSREEYTGQSYEGKSYEDESYEEESSYSYGHWHYNAGFSIILPIPVLVGARRVYQKKKKTTGSTTDLVKA